MPQDSNNLLPREKLMAFGPSALTDVELLAILIGTGTKDENVLVVAEKLLQEAGNGSLAHLSKRKVGELTQIKGIGQAKGIIIASVLELGKRIKLSEEKLAKRPSLNTVEKAVAYCEKLLLDLPTEHFYGIFLNTKGQVITEKLINSGNLNQVAVDVQALLRDAILCRASKVIVAHNHPSGNPTPSQEDMLLTTQILGACQLLSLSLLDHLIIAGRDSYYSFKEENKL